MRSQIGGSARDQLLLPVWPRAEAAAPAIWPVCGLAGRVGGWLMSCRFRGQGGSRGGVGRAVPTSCVRSVGRGRYRDSPTHVVPRLRVGGRCHRTGRWRGVARFPASRSPNPRRCPTRRQRPGSVRRCARQRRDRRSRLAAVRPGGNGEREREELILTFGTSTIAPCTRLVKVAATRREASPPSETPFVTTRAGSTSAWQRTTNRSCEVFQGDVL